MIRFDPERVCCLTCGKMTSDDRLPSSKLHILNKRFSSTTHSTENKRHAASLQYLALRYPHTHTPTYTRTQTRTLLVPINSIKVSSQTQLVSSKGDCCPAQQCML